jgi:phosphoglycerate dehydrogenase-like enzyme
MQISIVLAKPNLSKELIQELESLGEINIVDAKNLSEEEAIDKIPDAEILVCGSSGFPKIGKKMLSGLKKLKFIAILGVGYEWIDIEEAKKRGILIARAKGSNSEAVAEHVWGMILNLCKRISEFDREVRSTQDINVFNYQGLEVFKKTIGIIGLGEIGKRVARIAHGFDMNVIGVNNSGNPVSGVNLVSMDELLSKSDIITTCFPLNDKTENTIDTPEIQKMKQGVILVNCSREALVNKSAVLQGIKNNIIFGYGIETEIMQPIGKHDEYLSHPRILINPHNAWNTKESLDNTFNLTIDNIKAFLKGKPINIVN